MASPTRLWRVSDSRPTCNASLFAEWQSSCLSIIVTKLLHWLALCLAIERTQVDGGYPILSTRLHYKAPACLDARSVPTGGALCPKDWNEASFTELLLPKGEKPDHVAKPKPSPCPPTKSRCESTLFRVCGLRRRTATSLFPP